VTFLEFLPVSAVAGVVPPDLRFFTDVGPISERHRIQKFPLSVFLFEGALLVVILIFSFERVLRVKNDRAGFIRRFAGFFLKDVEALPFGILRPSRNFLAIHVVTRGGVVGREDEVDMPSNERSITRTEKIFRGLRFGLSGLDGLATISVSFSGRAGAVFGRSDRRHREFSSRRRLPLRGLHRKGFSRR